MTRTLLIDRRFRGVGRICLATGTTNPIVLKKYSRMLDALRDEGRIAVLRAIRDGELTFAEAYEAYRAGALNQLDAPHISRPLHKTYARWAKVAEVSDKHRVSLGTSGTYFRRADQTARVGDLPRILRKLRDALGVKHPRSFNLAKAAATAFVGATLTRAHPLYGDCCAVPQRKVVKQRRGRPLTPAELQGWFPNRDSDPYDAAVWAMATTGMGQGEYWGRWNLETDYIHIHGTKREARNRFVPLVLPIAPPRMHRRTFEDWLRTHTNRAIQPYDLRRTYANALESVDILRTRRRLYLGHSARDVTDLYEHHDVRRFCAEDAAKLRGFFGLPPVISPVMRVERGGA